MLTPHGAPRVRVGGKGAPAAIGRGAATGLRLVRAPRRALEGPYMTVADLEYLGRAIFAHRAWRASLGALLGIEVTTITRWCDGSLPIPRWLAITCWALYAARQHGAFPVPEPDPRWDQFAWMEGAELPPVDRRRG